VLAVRERERRYLAAERLLAAPMLVLSLSIIPVLLLPLAWPGMPVGVRSDLDAADAGIWVAFAAEYLLLLFLAPARRVFVRTHLVELVLVLLPMLRPLRILRSARLLRLARAGRAVAGAASAAKLSRRHLATSAGLYAPAAALVLVLAGAAVARDAERSAPGGNIKSYGDAVWWAMTTVTTVGYGDRYPVTATGRVVAVGLMLVGIALLGIVTASLAAAFSRWPRPGMWPRRRLPRAPTWPPSWMNCGRCGRRWLCCGPRRHQPPNRRALRTTPSMPVHDPGS
jgi:voltage-gated potassium channel